ncbi:unnamed protein product [Mycena citricolor]|uniref:Uncharacterized protein n=1 Tax=Mycena citricolor TaxID=2018698 RepID=A0AAD2K3C3_9AGAR|nr:unnamed protein product [Mycena citricolor]CAK5276578.1 unnamed protein product [Mycena citricolor]
MSSLLSNARVARAREDSSRTYLPRPPKGVQGRRKTGVFPLAAYGTLSCATHEHEAETHMPRRDMISHSSLAPSLDSELHPPWTCCDKICPTSE